MLPQSEPAPPADPSPPLRVLIIEDNLDAAEGLATLLELWRHQVQVVHDGVAALNVLETSEPEVILLDIGLPGLDGYQVAAELQKDGRLSRALVVAMTGYGQEEDRRRSQEVGIQHHFVKPIQPAQLKSLLDDFNLTRR